MMRETNLQLTIHMAREDNETNLTRPGNSHPSRLKGDGELQAGCPPQGENQARPVLYRLKVRGQLTAVAGVLLLYSCLFLLSKLEAQRRQAELGYCSQGAVAQLTQQKSTSALGNDLAVALSAANERQRQRIAQQAKEAIELFQYHCRNMLLYSSDFQSLLIVANSAGIVMLGILAWLSQQARGEVMHWPLPVIVTSACSFALALATTKTFELQANLLNSRSLSQQSKSIARSYATSIANEAFQKGSRTTSLETRTGLAQFLEQMDSSLALIDRPIFALSDQVDENGARFLYQKMIPGEK